MHTDSNAKFPAVLRPAAGTRCFVSLGDGYEATVGGAGERFTNKHET